MLLQMQKENRVRLFALIVCLAIIAPHCPANAAAVDGTNSFPSPNEIFQGRAFTNKFERDVFFLRKIRESYPMHWAPLLEANVTIADYVVAPDKLLRFVEELGAATANTDDATAVTNLAAINADPEFYANTNASRPEIDSAAALALM